MKCPVCPRVTMIVGDLVPGLPCRTCSQCGGRWISMDAYARWVGQQHQESPGTEPVRGEETPATRTPISDNLQAKLCPECTSFLRREKVGHGLPFHVERCGRCGSFWLDRGEWEELERQGFHTRIPLIFQPHWQAEVAAEDHSAAWEEVALHRLGDVDYAAAKRIREWLTTHPERKLLEAYLFERLPAGDRDA